MKKFLSALAITVVAFLVLSVTGCASKELTPDDVYTVTVHLEDSRTVDCIMLVNRYGLSCDWENAR